MILLLLDDLNHIRDVNIALIGGDYIISNVDYYVNVLILGFDFVADFDFHFILSSSGLSYIFNYITDSEFVKGQF